MHNFQMIIVKMNCSMHKYIHWFKLDLEYGEVLNLSINPNTVFIQIC